MNKRLKKKMYMMKLRSLNGADVAEEMKTNKRDIGAINIKALKNGEEEKKEYNLSFSSEDAYFRRFYNPQKREFENLPEILSHEEGAIDYKRLQDLGTVLFNHNMDIPIAKITNVKVEDKRGIASIEFGDDEESQKYKSKVDSGILKGVSVGYVVNKYERRKNYYDYNGKKIDAMIATKWTIHEISIVSVPADATVGVGRDIIQEEVNYSLYERQLIINKYKFGGKGNERAISKTTRIA